VEEGPFRRRILVVDDDKAITEMLGLMLRDLRYLCVACNDPQEALALFTRNPYRFYAAIVDEIMPGVRGTELTGQFLQVRGNFPVILLTGHGGLLTMDQIRGSGVRATLIKPIYQADLRLALERVLRRTKRAS
jgi:CheY-like chemotaxis protein